MYVGLKFKFVLGSLSVFYSVQYSGFFILFFFSIFVIHFNTLFS